MAHVPKQTQEPGMIPHSLLDTTGMPARQAFALWHEQMGSLGDIRLSRDLADGFEAHVEAFLLGNMVLCVSRSMAQTFDRSRFRIAQDGVDHYVLRFFARGNVFCRKRDLDYKLGSQDLLFHDLSAVMRTAISDVEALSLIVPRSMLAPLIKDPDATGSRVLRGDGNILTELLHDHLWSLFRLAPGMSTANAAALIRPTLDLTAAAINGTVAEEAMSGVETCLVDAICRHVHLNILDRDLSPATLAARFGISRRKLSYLFEERGGISAHIQTQRLHLARQVLADPAERNRTIGDIAERFGFAHRPNFSRAFERVHGMSPRQVRAFALAKKPLVQDGSHFSWHEWIRQPRSALASI
ncbi:AraC-like DNA-binding protein [Mesorhizobium soli]|uniref:AraC family transcriptional regulator n=1 Tax=Pseudaminobacter soli (ex Li et al. 2025) TaxID=1295366 RepID=UPI002477061D|nr:AraC family transcriptional regulator [Mesorhizobium soli]MDH6232252.1 AraC-like DNA-binding protein [Mesorhizobium soli]